LQEHSISAALVGQLVKWWFEYREWLHCCTYWLVWMLLTNGCQVRPENRSHDQVNVCSNMENGSS